MISVRDAERADGPALAAAHLEGWRSGYRGVVPDAYLDSPEFAANRRSIWAAWNWNHNGASALFTVTIDDDVVGFGLCGPERAQTECDQQGGEAAASGAAVARGEVYSFYLHPSAWGTGAAGALMARCRAWLTEQGHLEAVLWVLRDNPRGRGFYEKVGWQPTGRELSFDLAVPGGTTHPLYEVEYLTVLP